MSQSVARSKNSKNSLDKVDDRVAKLKNSLTKGKNSLAKGKKFNWNAITKNWQLYILILLPVVYILLFKYFPMYGAQIAFKKYSAAKGIMESPWVGFKHFVRFFESPKFWDVIKNTIGISVYQLAAGFPLPIVLALLLNYCRNTLFKKTVQMVTYAPHFISTVVICGLILQVLSPRYGIISNAVRLLGFEPKNIMGIPEAFSSVYVWSGIWQNVGWGSIIYLAALSAIDESQHEAAIVDGATVLKRIWHVDIPGILPTAVILLILNTGHILNVGFEKALLLQNPMNMTASEVVQTYVYKVGLNASIPDYSYASAIGLFISLISLILLTTVNKFAKKFSETSLW